MSEREREREILDGEENEHFFWLMDEIYFMTGGIFSVQKRYIFDPFSDSITPCSEQWRSGSHWDSLALQSECQWKDSKKVQKWNHSENWDFEKQMELDSVRREERKKAFVQWKLIFIFWCGNRMKCAFSLFFFFFCNQEIIFWWF